jgi:hypothetical protein
MPLCKVLWEESSSLCRDGLQHLIVMAIDWVSCDLIQGMGGQLQNTLPYSVTQSKGPLGKLLELADHAPQPYFGVRPSNAKPGGLC